MNMMEKAKNREGVPVRYGMKQPELKEFVSLAHAGRGFDAVTMAYTLGFLRGRSCEKRTQAQSNK